MPPKKPAKKIGDPLIGAIVERRWQILDQLGSGGMGVVYRAERVGLGKQVAVKFLHQSVAESKAAVGRFEREAKAISRLHHMHCISILDFGVYRKQPYIVMEFVQGRTLRDIIKAEGRLPVRRALEITADVCAAIDFSHRNGIVHRDIKPANVMITESGAVKVMDFGIARAMADDQATVTQTANVIGTAQYLSPEQARGETVDARSDVYSTGCLLYELVSGSPPFQGDSPVAVAYQHVRESAMAPSSRNPQVPPAVDSIVMKAISKNQLNRYQTAGEMRSDLQRALADQPVAAEAVMSDAERTQFIARTPPPPVAVARREEYYEDEEERNNSMVWVAIVVALLLVIGAAVAAILLIGKNKGTPKVTIPSIVGQVPAAAETTLRGLGLNPVVATDPTSGACDGGQAVKDGQVCLVDPKEGSSVDKNATVTITLFKTPSVQVPNVTGLNVNDAEAKLHTAGLKWTTKNVDTNQAAQGTVVAQDKPPFSEVAPGSTVVLSVSSGKVKLLDVRGKKEADAVAALNGAGWTQVDATQTQQGPDKSKDGTVVDEQPTPGLAYPQTTQITLTIYQYVAPTPTNSTSTTGTGTGTATGTTTPTGSTTTP
jgi:beta-lactam-binding protein with PASTA domain/tRNA A-37 threonylcarbamoyl transferase component Bud32